MPQEPSSKKKNRSEGDSLGSQLAKEAAAEERLRREIEAQGVTKAEQEAAKLLKKEKAIEAEKAGLLRAIEARDQAYRVALGKTPFQKLLREQSEAIKNALGSSLLGIPSIGDSLGKVTFGSLLNPIVHNSTDKQITDSIKRYIGEDQSRDLQLEKEIDSLREQARSQGEEIRRRTANNEKDSKEIENLRKIVEEMQRKQDIQHLLNSVSAEAGPKIESDDEFRRKFTSDSFSFVVSVDIRRSTELMLKARTPKLFADFITTLCGDLVDIFKRNLGVVDKFTGDGILAFFPDFYSGEDAGYLALRAAAEATQAFEVRYRQFRSSFSVILSDVGLGIGIDYGDVHLVRMAGALTIVGQPVVYACRMGGAPAGRIYLNQGAYDQISDRYAHLVNIQETTISIKGDGALVAYDVALTGRGHSPCSPAWLSESASEEPK